MLTNYDARLVDEGTADPDRYRRPAARPEVTPSSIVLSEIAAADAQALDAALGPVTQQVFGMAEEVIPFVLVFVPLALSLGYDSIVGGGRHATTLHWIDNDGPITPGGLVLLDMGVEGRNLYTADVTRTLPINGTFSSVQRELYDLVYAAQQAAAIRGALLPAFAEIDAFAAELAGRADRLLVVSDHGFRPEEGKFYANRFLARHGLAALRPSLARALSEGAIRLFGRDRLRRLLPKALIEGGLAAAAPAVEGRAFAAPLAAQGIFAADEEARAEVMRLLRELRDPRTGAPLATALYTREELYAGPECHRFPHIVLELAGGGIEVSPHLLLSLIHI